MPLRIVVLGAILLAPCFSFPALAFTGTVAAVHDGDTFTLAGNQRVRVFGIDAPELRQRCKTLANVCTPCGEGARQALESLILGKDVTCTDRGKSYDRVVGECSVGKVQIGPWMLSHGWAVAYESFLKKADKPAYIGAQSGAKRAKDGIPGPRKIVANCLKRYIRYISY